MGAREELLEDDELDGIDYELDELPGDDLEQPETPRRALEGNRSSVDRPEALPNIAGVDPATLRAPRMPSDFNAEPPAGLREGALRPAAAPSDEEEAATVAARARVEHPTIRSDTPRPAHGSRRAARPASPRPVSAGPTSFEEGHAARGSKRQSATQLAGLLRGRGRLVIFVVIGLAFGLVLGRVVSAHTDTATAAATGPAKSTPAGPSARLTEAPAKAARRRAPARAVVRRQAHRHARAARSAPPTRARRARARRPAQRYVAPRRMPAAPAPVPAPAPRPAPVPAAPSRPYTPAPRPAAPQDAGAATGAQVERGFGVG